MALEFQLRALRGLLVAAVGLIDSIVETADIDGPAIPAPPQPAPVAAPEVPSEPAVEEPPGCRHPIREREARPVMGDPGQFFCNACQGTVSGREGL